MSVRSPRDVSVAAKAQSNTGIQPVFVLTEQTALQCLLSTGRIPDAWLHIGSANEFAIKTGKLPSALLEISGMGSIGLLADALGVAPEDLGWQPSSGEPGSGQDDLQNPDEGQEPGAPAPSSPGCGMAPVLLVLAGLVGLMGLRGPSRMRSPRGGELCSP